MHIEVPSKNITGIGILCSDPREPIWKETKTHLILPGQYFIAIGILGGPISLANPSEIPVQFAALMEQISFAIKTFDQGQDFEFLSIGHDCGFYANMRRTVTLHEKKEDIHVSCEFLQKRFGKRARGYFFHRDHRVKGNPFEWIYGQP